MIEGRSFRRDLYFIDEVKDVECVMASKSNRVFKYDVFHSSNGVA